MAQLVVTYKKPKDAGFETYYFETHVPLTKKIPGLTKFEVSEGPVMTPSGPSDVALIATLHFADEASMMAAFGSPERRAAGADVAAFMGPEDTLLFYSNREV
jgi:uncharacterized protein (TIGR02118 family)